MARPVSLTPVAGVAASRAGGQAAKRKPAAISVWHADIAHVVHHLETLAERLSARPTHTTADIRSLQRMAARVKAIGERT